METIRRLMVGLAFTSLAVCATACRDETLRKTEEAAESAGEDIEAGAGKAVEKTKELGRDVKREVGPALERAGEKLQQKGAEVNADLRDEPAAARDAGVRPAER